ncbi:MAG: hypothetical protein PVH40_10125, partial [Gemmatimonadales bacterium]
MTRAIGWIFPLLFLFPGCAESRPEADLLITDATVFDARTGTATPGMAVYVEHGLISRVGTVADLSGIGAEQVVSARGRLLIP